MPSARARAMLRAVSIIRRTLNRRARPSILTLENVRVALLRGAISAALLVPYALVAYSAHVVFATWGVTIGLAAAPAALLELAASHRAPALRRDLTLGAVVFVLGFVAGWLGMEWSAFLQMVRQRGLTIAIETMVYFYELPGVLELPKIFVLTGCIGVPLAVTAVVRGRWPSLVKQVGLVGVITPLVVLGPWLAIGARWPALVAPIRGALAIPLAAALADRIEARVRHPA